MVWEIRHIPQATLCGSRHWTLDSLPYFFQRFNPSKSIMPLWLNGLLRVKKTENTFVRREGNIIIGFRYTADGYWLCIYIYIFVKNVGSKEIKILNRITQARKESISIELWVLLRISKNIAKARIQIWHQFLTAWMEDIFINV